MLAIKIPDSFLLSTSSYACAFTVVEAAAFAHYSCIWLQHNVEPNLGLGG